MMSQISRYAQQLRIASPAALVRQLGRWWLGEFLALFPPGLAAWLTGDDRKRIVAFAGRDGICFEVCGSRGEILASVAVDGDGYSDTSLDRFLAQHGLRREDIDIGIRLGTDQVFERHFLLPPEAKSALPEIIAQNLTRKTPFKLAEVYHDFDAAAAHDGKIEITQWVMRRSVVAEFIAKLRLAPSDVGFVTADAATPGRSPAFLRLCQDRSNRAEWTRIASVVLLGSYAALAIALVGSRLYCQQLALDDLDTRLASLAPKAQQIRTLVADFERAQSVVIGVRLRKQNAVGLLDLWEEATRVMPHDTWLTELRLIEATEKHEPRVVMIGFSTAAARLVGVVDASPLLADAALTTPIARDNQEERERFSIEATLRRRSRQEAGR
jgi:general secretion pathway protein L